MKRTSIYYFSLAAIAAGSLASCQDFDPLDEDTLQKITAQQAFEATLNEYTTNFETRFGKIDPNNNWGFDLHEMKSSSKTRAQVANKNEWESIYHLQVPGWPDVWYEYKAGGDPVRHVGQGEGKEYHNNSGSVDSYDATAATVPGGDVTDEEIQYVSWWFRTHRYPTSINVHWSDFYIQDISADNDRDAAGNKVTEAPEYTAVTSGAMKGSWQRNRTESINFMEIDQIKVKTYEENYDHIYNFNAGQSNSLSGINTLSMSNGTYDWNDDVAERMKGHTTNRMMAFYKTSGTEDWAAHYSNDEQWRSNYVDKQIWTMVHLHFVGKSGRIYDGYYIGFDYAFHKASSEKYQMRKPDGYYSNWIVKVSPGVPLNDDQEHGGYTKRIMCEDLGNTWDLDFDDVVFDATINLTQTEYNEYYNQIKDLSGAELAAKKAALQDVDVTITLMAAGGTMPIWVGINPREVSTEKKNFYEIHHLFGTSESTPVNVANGYDAPIANYHISMKSIDFDDIPIYIYNNRINEYVELPKSVVGNHDLAHTQMNTSDKSKAPQKFAVPTSVLWLKETHQIEKGYKNFDAYVQNATANSTWYATNIDASHLCGMAAETPVINTPAPGQENNSGLVGTSSTYQSILHYDVIPLTNNKEWGWLEVSNGVNSVSTKDGNNVSMDFAAGATATLIAHPLGTAEFVRWDDGQNGHPGFNSDLVVDSSNPNKATVSVDGMKYIMAYFQGEGNGYTLNLVENGGKIRIDKVERNSNSVTPIPSSFQDQDKVFLSIESCPSGKAFRGWIINGNTGYIDPNPTPQVVFNSGADITVEAVFADICNLPISVSFVDAGDNVIEYSGYQNTITLGNDPTNHEYSKVKTSGTYICAVGQQVQYCFNLDNEYDIYLNDTKLETSPNSFTVESSSSKFIVIFKKK